jgi:transposase InsO family protein
MKPNWKALNFQVYTDVVIAEIKAEIAAKKPKYEGWSTGADGKLWVKIDGQQFEIVPESDIDARLQAILDDPKLMIRGRDRLYERLKDLRLVGISRGRMMEYLAKDMVYQTHSRINRVKVNKPIISTRPLERVQIDLIDMSDLAGFNDRRAYALTMVDHFSKFAWVRPLIRKSAASVRAAIEPILRAHTPKILQSDNGGEFVNDNLAALLAELEIKQVLGYPYKPSTNGLVERFNRTLKTAIQQYIAATGDKKWYRAIDLIVENYNTAYHSSIKNKPSVVFATVSRKLKAEVRENIDSAADKMLEESAHKPGIDQSVIKVGDFVRITLIRADSKERSLDLKGMRKSTGQNFTTDVYRVDTISKDPGNKLKLRQSYMLTNAFVWHPRRKQYMVGNGRIIDRIYYRSELLRVPKPEV